ncbi:hypothetical protein J7T55_013432 [Diaporthe amygdali]|uniref:uncharacterized protein n=1 Tax=Phomopsis amygdali TaxID=1214568 RepID=UPI0022FE62EA|nr:uncharacterized protein J7T55_013432 [Diaporthe amygdali]KAJ0119195.1 hypothetical protein J7T55_013432 [Diaporthe amygdali]
MAPGIYRIPPEIVRNIAVESGCRELAALALTARIFNVWFNPHLYKHNINHQNANAAIWAAKTGRLNTLLRLYETQTGSRPNLIDELWNSRYHWDSDFRDMLSVEKGACGAGTAMQFTLLHLAVRSGHDDVVVWLLQQGANIEPGSKRFCECDRTFMQVPGWTPLHIAICYSQEKIAKILLSHGASVQTNKRLEIQALHIAARRGLTSTILYLSTLLDFNPNVRDSKKETPLHYATKEPSGFAAIKTLLDVGADPDGADGDEPLWTPLYGAIVVGNFEAAITLLNSGAKPWVHREKVARVKRDRQNWRNVPPLLPLPLLHVALRTKENFSSGAGERYDVCRRKIVRMLLDHGIDINERLSGTHARHLRETEGMTTLMMAIKYSDPITVRLLLERGAKVNLRDSHGESAFQYALCQSPNSGNSGNLREDKIQALLEHGVELLDDTPSLLSVVLEIIPSPDTLVRVLIDNMGPENLTTPGGASRALELCCRYKKYGLYHAIRKNSHVEMTEDNIRSVLKQVSRSNRASVVAFLRRTHPKLPLGSILDSMSFDVETSRLKILPI